MSAASAYHQAIEALRWARCLMASGVPASQIAIATAFPGDYDEHFLTLRGDANIDLHFVHGVRTVTTRDGQAAAALADIVVRGLSQSRLHRLATLCRENGPFKGFPDGWMRILLSDAPLSTAAAWARILPGLTAEDWPDGVDHAPALRKAVEVLAKGPAATGEIREAFLTGACASVALMPHLRATADKGAFQIRSGSSRRH